MKIVPARLPLAGKLLFQEKQVFRQLPFLLLPGLLQILFLWGFIQQVIFDKPWGTRPSGDMALVLINLGNLLIIFFLLNIVLDLRITDLGISFRMRPLHWRWRNIVWTEIQSARIIKYDGIRDYLGYGMRYSRKRGWCYTISGPDGLELKSGRQERLLIGTHQGKKLQKTLGDLQANGEINKI
ncbi:MAG: hypothetical protein U0T82_08460 [Bacteroidales bacterium]